MTLEGPAPGAAGERLLARLLYAAVHREPQLAALLRALHRQLALEVAERVDLHPGGAVAAAQEAVVLLLDARLADAVAHLDAAVARVLELFLRDLADRAEQVGADLVEGVLAQEDALDGDAREVVPVLEHPGHDVVRGVLLDGRRRERLCLELPVDRAADAPRRKAEHPSQPAVDPHAFDLVVGELVGGDLHSQADAVLD